MYIFSLLLATQLVSSLPTAVQHYRVVFSGGFDGWVFLSEACVACTTSSRIVCEGKFLTHWQPASAQPVHFLATHSLTAAISDLDRRTNSALFRTSAAFSNTFLNLFKFHTPHSIGSVGTDLFEIIPFALSVVEPERTAIERTSEEGLCILRSGERRLQARPSSRGFIVEELTCSVGQITLVSAAEVQLIRGENPDINFTCEELREQLNLETFCFARLTDISATGESSSRRTQRKYSLLGIFDFRLEVLINSADFGESQVSLVLHNQRHSLTDATLLQSVRSRIPDLARLSRFDLARSLYAEDFDTWNFSALLRRLDTGKHSVRVFVPDPGSDPRFVNAH